MKKIVLLGVLLLFLGCAHHNSNHYADYQRSFGNEMIFYSQYEILFKVTTKKGEQLVVAPFLADANNYLPEKVVKLHFGLSVINPKRETFTVWIDYKNEYFERSRIVYKSQSLPKEFISVDLPFDFQSNSTDEIKVICEILVLGKGGNLLYRSPMARYKVKGVQK